MAMKYGFKAQGDRDSDVYRMFSFAPQSPFSLNLNYGTIPNGDPPTQAWCSNFLLCQPTPKNFFSNLLTFELVLSPSQYFRYTLYGSRMQE